MDKCPVCGRDGFIGFNMFHCENPDCQNYDSRSYEQCEITDEDDFIVDRIISIDQGNKGFRKVFRI